MVSDLRKWIDSLDSKELLHTEQSEVDIRSCSSLILDNYKRATLFPKIAGYDYPLIANAVSSRGMMALALESSEKGLLDEYQRRISSPVKPVFSSSTDGECQEHVTLGDDRVDLTTLPILLQHELDGAPYITSGLLISRDPQTSEYNIGIYRLMFRKKNELGINITAPHRVRWFYQKALKEGKPLDVAICLGLHALDLLAAVTTAPSGVDELSIWGGIQREPIKLVPAKTLDGLYVPSHAEIVIEAQLEPVGWSEPEGPYGEFPGTYSGMRKNPTIKVRAITSRRSAIYQSATHGGRHLENTDFFVLIPEIELSIHQALVHAGVDVRAVRVLPSGAGMICFLSISQRSKGDARNALYVALAGSRQNFPKYCVIVDEDIDVMDDSQVIWAIATRSQPAEDVILLDGMRIPSSSDPSLFGGPPFSMSKMGLDATIPIERDRQRFKRSEVPKKEETEGVRPRTSIHLSDEEAVAREIQEILKSGPLYFSEVLDAVSGATYRTVLRAWSLLRERALISQNESGRYELKST